MLTSRRPQRTIQREATVEGISFLGGLDVLLRFLPAPAGTGILYRRVDLPDAPEVPARVEFVIPRQRRTTIQRGEALVEMVEHVNAGLAGLQIDNCIVEIDGPETPGCDGSSLAFVEALEAAGVVDQDAPRPLYVIEKPVTVQEGNAILSAHPGDADKLVLTYNLDYGQGNPIGKQSLFVDMLPGAFRKELVDSRTFLLDAEADFLRKSGIGVRTTEKDLLIFGPDGVIGNTLRHKDECVRHKMLDLVGDLALFGQDIAGHVVAHRSGHQLNASLVRRLKQVMLREKKASLVQDSTALLDINQIMRILPHRYPFLLVDRVIEIIPGQRVVALKNVTCNEPFFPGHWPTQPIMPGVLIIEALAQTAGLLIANHHGVEGRSAVIASIDGVKLRRPVVPGDQLVMEVTGVRIKSRTAVVVGVARIGGEVAAEAKIRFHVIDTARAA